MEAKLAWNGGVNVLEDPNAISDNQLAESKNAYPSLEGLLDKREAVKAIGGIISSSPSSFQVQPITLFVPDKVLGLDFILHGTFRLAGGEFYTAVRLDQTMGYTTADVNTTFLQYDAQDLLRGPASMVNYKGRVIACSSEMEGYRQLNKKADGTFYWTTVTFKWPGSATGVVDGQTQTDPVLPSVVGTCRGRLVFANFGTGKGNWLVFGDRDTQANWTNIDEAPPWAIVGDDVLSSNGRHLELSAIQGETILAVKEISLASVGSPLQNALLVLTNKTAIICTGEPAQTTDSDFDTAAGYIGSFEANKVNYEVGIAGPNTFCETPYGLCWASGNDVWLMNGNTPVAVGTLIRPALRECPPSLRRFWSMAYGNGCVFLAICTQASVSEKDLRIQHWRLDLRRGPPGNFQEAHWYGPQDYENLPTWAGAGNTAVMASTLVSKRDDVTDVVYGAIQAFGAGDPKTFIISFNEAEGGEDIPFPDIRSGRAWSADDHTDGVTVPIGDVVCPTILQANGHLYRCKIAGIPGVTEPVWPIGAGDTVVDGTSTWEEIQGTTTWTRLINYGAASYYFTNLMDIMFKEISFGQPARDKVLRRVDINAYYGFRALMAMRAIINQGSQVKILGPTPIGGDTLGENDLGTLQLDVGAAAMSGEYQARSLRPGSSEGREASAPLFAWTVNDTGLYTTGGVIRGRYIQPRFTDDDGIVIDETNNFISWCSYNVATPGILEVFTAELTEGRYDTIFALMTEIITRMNTAQGTAISGFTIAASPWSNDDAFAAVFPYMTTFKFAFSSRQWATIQANVSFIFGDSEDEVTLMTKTCYPRRTKRLLALLGLNTTNDYKNAIAIAATYSDASQVQFVGEQWSPQLSSPTRICGTEVIPYKRSPVVSLSDIQLDYYIKPGLPFSKRSR